MGPCGPALRDVVSTQGWDGEPDPGHLADPHLVTWSPGSDEASQRPKSIVEFSRSQINMSSVTLPSCPLQACGFAFLGSPLLAHEAVAVR